MKQPRPLLALTLALVFPLLGEGTLVARAQPPGDPFDGGPLFGDGPGGQRGPGGPGGRGGRDDWGGPGGPDGRAAPGRPGRRGGPRGVKGRLEGTWRSIQRLQSDDKSLSKSQAARLVSLIKPWSNQPTMSDADAQKLVQSLDAVLTPTQKSKLGPPGRGGPPQRGRGQGGPPRGDGDFGPPPPRDGEDGPPPPPPEGDFGRPDGRGPGGPPGNRPPATFNPFYAPTGRSDWNKLPSTTQQLLARRYRDNRAVLESLSRFAKS